VLVAGVPIVEAVEAVEAVAVEPLPMLALALHQVADALPLH
jgi:hypothetical protein